MNGFRLLFALCLTVVNALAAAPPKLLPAEQRTPVADFNLRDTSEAMVRLSSLKGQVVLLNFWATTCGGCKIELPWLIELDKRHRDHGFVTLGVSMDDDSKVVKPFLEQKGIRYPVVMGNDNVARQFGLTAMPMTLLIDRSGRIALSHTGLVNLELFDGYIGQLLNQRK